MTDNNTGNNDTGNDTGGEDAESHFWTEHEKRTTEILDKWFDKKIADAKNQSRNGGRTTLPKIFADMFFPAPK